MIVRRLTDADADNFRAIRLEGLKCYPTAFRASYEQEAAENLPFFANRLKVTTMFGGFDGSALRGVVGFHTHGPGKESLKGVLYGMYVRGGGEPAGGDRRNARLRG